MPELFTVLTGLAGGAKAVVTLFNVCVRAYNTIERSSSHGSEHTKLMVKFDIEKFRFLSWGASLSFVRGENEATPRRYEDIGLLISANVEGQTVQELIKRTLSAIVMTFGDTTELRKRYGLGPVASLDRPSSASQTSGEPFRETFKRFHSRIIRTQREASLVETMRWAILDGDKFKALIKEVHDWNDDLDNILKLIKRHNTHIRIMQCEIERMSSVDEISIIEEVSAGDNPTISGAASIRLQTIEAASTRETGSSVADANTISTRLSHGTSKSSGINPKLLETVEDVLRRLIFPELKAFKQENNRKKFERDHRSSVASGSTGTSGDSRDEVRVTRKVPTRSSAPDIKPKIRIDDRDVTVGESSRQTRREDRDGSLRYDRRSATEEREITRPRSRKSDENKTLLGTIGAAPGLTAAAAATHHQRSKDSLDETKESSVAAANTISTRLSYETAPTEPGQPNEAQPEHEDEQPEHNELTSDIPQNMRLFTGQTVARNFAQVSLADIDRHGQAIQDIRRADMAEFQRRQEGFQLCKDEIDRLKDNKGSHAPRRLLSEILRFARLPDHISIGLLNDDIVGIVALQLCYHS
jgi:hypothetical protein